MGDRQIDVRRRHAADVGGQEAEFNRVLGERVREARHARNLTQEQLANLLGVARASVANLERGAQAPTAYRLVRLAEMLGMPTSELLPELNGHVSASKLDLEPAMYLDVVRTLKAAAKKQAKAR